MKGTVCVLFLFLLTLGSCKDCPNKRISSKLVCYYTSLKNVDRCYCTHVVLPPNSEPNAIKEVREKLAGTGVKILLTVTDFNQVFFFYLNY